MFQRTEMKEKMIGKILHCDWEIRLSINLGNYIIHLERIKFGVAKNHLEYFFSRSEVGQISARLKLKHQ